MDLRNQIVVLLMLWVCVSTSKGMIPEQTNSGFILTPSATTANDDAAITVGLVNGVDNSFGFGEIDDLILFLTAGFIISSLVIPVPTPSGVPMPMIQALMTPDTTQPAQPAVIPVSPPASTTFIQVPGQPGSVVMIPSPPAPHCNECPNGYTTVSGNNNGKCYKFVDVMVLCDIAFIDCNDDFNNRGVNGKLWEPDTEPEAENLFNNLIQGTSVWTGALQRNGNAAVATYPDNSPLANFATTPASGECRDSNSQNECVQINNEMTGFIWCYRRRHSPVRFGPYVCQIERNSCP